MYDSFYPNVRYADGFTSWCRSCFSEHRVKRRRERMLSDPEYREEMRARHRHYKAMYGYGPGDPADSPQRRARVAVRAALQRGDLTPTTACEDCGHDFSDFRREAHHEDYGEPLEVVWLCSHCHGAKHKTDRAA